MTSTVVKRWTKLPDYFSSEDMTTALLHFDRSKCKKCDICTFICPARSIARDTKSSPHNEGYPFLKFTHPGITDCVACGCCLAACPEGAISIHRGFNAGHYYRRLTQTGELVRPRRYVDGDDSAGSDAIAGPPGGDPGDMPPPVTRRRAIRQKINWLRLAGNALTGASVFAINEIRRGRGWPSIKKLVFGSAFDISWARLLEESSEKVPDKKGLLYNDEIYTYRQMNENANRLAHFLLPRKNKGKGVGLILRNSPRFLDIFFGAQKAGMYLVPINPELKGDGLAYIVNHSDIATLVVDAELLAPVFSSMERFDRIGPEDIIVNDAEPEAGDFTIPDKMPVLSPAYDLTADKPGVAPAADDICLIIYTSGTTGRPKGVVYRYNTSGVQKLSLGGNIFFSPRDIYYTYLSLCHGNALFLTVTMSLSVKCTIALSRKFSAGRFWDTVRKYDATVFNTIGTIIPILMKQPEKTTDRHNKVRLVFSAACPLDMWAPFEKRFGVELYEGYGAVDGGGKGIMNLGTAPPGSLGKPTRRKSIRIVDENGCDVPDGTAGELLFKTRTRKSVVEYYKNPDATQNKSNDGWLHTGDIVKRDGKGYLYFVGRNTESMRKGGENVSAYEVEHVIMQETEVEDVAVYPVPSDLGEDDIMAAIKPVDGHAIDPAELRLRLIEKLARFAVPRYIRLVDAFPKTNTHRIIKPILVQEGVTPDTYDALEKGDANACHIGT